MIQFARFYGHSVLRSRLDAKSVVVDLGSNRGAFATAVLTAAGCKVYCAEPNPQLCEGLARRAGLTVFNVAIAPVSGRLRFNLADNDECSSLFSPTTSAVSSAIECEALTLAGFLDRTGVTHVDLLKIDIEGAELALLANTDASVLACVDQIAVEFHESIGIGTVQDIRNIVRRLEGLGFRAFKGSFTDFSDVLFMHPGRLGLGPGWEWQAQVWRLREGFGRRLDRAWRGAVTWRIPGLGRV
ncbi:MAG: FkbM family methyltransferase [Verrucomicrobia bacterium]|nr:FkbM family methyltransferase [Verrucomicrobiota bacterium]